MPTVSEPVTVFADGDIGWREEFRAHQYARAIHFSATQYNELLSIPAVTGAVRQLWEEGQLPQPQCYDDAGRPIPDLPFERLLGSLGQLPLDAVFSYLDECGMYVPDEVRLVDAFIKEQQRRFRTHVDVVAVAPLADFDAEVSVALRDGVAVTPLSGDDRTSLWMDEHLSRSFDKSAFARCRWALTRRQRRAVSEGREGDTAARFEDAVTALRLVAPGDVVAPAIVFYEEPAPTSSGMSSATRSRDRRLIMFMNTPAYQLKQSNARSFINVYEGLHELSENKRLGEFSVALRRFNLSYDRAHDEDKLIDLTVALESSLLFGVQDELRYRLALRGAALLRERRRPTDVHADLLRLYDVRSDLVHNGRLLHDMRPKAFGSIPPRDYARYARQMVREVLREFVHRLATARLDDVNRSLDERILRGLE